MIPKHYVGILVHCLENIMNRYNAIKDQHLTLVQDLFAMNLQNRK